MPRERLELVDPHHLAAARDAGVPGRVEVEEAVVGLVCDPRGGQVHAQHRRGVVVPTTRPKTLARPLQREPRLNDRGEIDRDVQDVLMAALAHNGFDADRQAVLADEEAHRRQARALAGPQRDRHRDAVEHRAIIARQPRDAPGGFRRADQARQFIVRWHASLASNVDARVKQFTRLERVRLGGALELDARPAGEGPHRLDVVVRGRVAEVGSLASLGVQPLLQRLGVQVFPVAKFLTSIEYALDPARDLKHMLGRVAIGEQALEITACNGVAGNQRRVKRADFALRLFSRVAIAVVESSLLGEPSSRRDRAEEQVKQRSAAKKARISEAAFGKTREESLRPRWQITEPCEDICRDRLMVRGRVDEAFDSGFDRSTGRLVPHGRKSLHAAVNLQSDFVRCVPGWLVDCHVSPFPSVR